MNEAWIACGGDEAAERSVRRSTASTILPSAFDVTGLAADTAEAALLAVAELDARRRNRLPPTVQLDVAHVCASFGAERHLQTTGWELPPAWDPIAGDYQTADGFIRLHTNYDHHRTAVCDVLDVAPDRDDVAAAVASWNGLELQHAVVAAAGAAAFMLSESGWSHSAQGQAVAIEPLVATTTSPTSGARTIPLGPEPLSGIRVLDLTRVIAGPTATQFLASYGASVLRIDPPGFAEVPLVLPLVTAGKRCASIDFTIDAGRDQLTELLGEADIVITSLRSDALDRAGFDDAALWRINPGVVVVRNSAYGWTGPMATTRGFDSLVQMSTGIAASGQTWAGADRPTPLPVQALDYGTGYLMAAAAVRGVTERLDTGHGSAHRVSLARTAEWLKQRPRPTDTPLASSPIGFLEPAATAWGPIQRVAPLGGIDGITPRYCIDPGELGRHEPRWEAQ
ncbi:MAG: CoA transferase [Acidimicrobiales bacterium]